MRAISLLKESISVIKKNIGLILILFLIVYVPVALLNSFAYVNLDNSQEVSRALELLMEQGISEEEKEFRLVMARDEMAKYYLYMLAFLAVSILAATFSLAVIKLSADSLQGSENTIEYDGEERNYQYYFSEAVKLLPKYIFSVLVACVMVICGMFLFVLPGIVAFVISTLVIYTVALTPFKGRPAFAFCGTVIAKKPTILIVIATVMLFDNLVSNVVLWGFEKLNISNVYGRFAAFAAVDCIAELLSVFGIVITAVAFFRAIKNIPALKELMAAGEKYEAEKKAKKERGE